MSELLKQLQKARRESVEACIAEQLEKLGFRGLGSCAQGPTDEAEKSIADLMGFLGLRPRAQEPTSEAEKSLADIKAEITATLEEVKAHIRANAKEGQEPAPDIATQASQQEQAVPPKEEPKQDPHYADGRDFFNQVFDRDLKEDAVRRLDEEARASQQEQATPACHLQLLRAFGLLMRRVGAPPEGAPGPVQKAVMRLAEVLAEGSEVSVKNFFDRARMADVMARRAKLEAKITRDDRPTKYGK